MSAAGLSLETLRLEQHGRVLIARIDAPPHNFMTGRMHRDLDALTAAVDEDAGVGAVIVTGDPGERFITHFTIAGILRAAERRDAMRAAASGETLGRFGQIALRIMRSPAVWIAAINGFCGGGGIELAVCFDVTIAAEEAEIVLPELLIGLTTTVGAQRLTQLIGPARALELMLEARPYTAAEAVRLGLIGRAVPRAQLLEAAVDKAELYARRPRAVVAAQKRIFNEHALLAPADSLRLEGAANAAGILAGPAIPALRRWVEMQEQSGDSVFVTDLEPWRRGEALDLNDPDLAG